MLKYRLVCLSAITGILIASGTPALASAVPTDDIDTISQEAVIKTSPDILYYENMALRVQKTNTLTVKNISGRVVEITPYLKLHEKYANSIAIDLKSCDEADSKCTSVAEDAEFTIPRGKSLKLLVGVTLKSEMPQAELQTISSMTADLQVRGDVLPNLPTDNTLRIIPKAETTGLESNSISWLPAGLVRSMGIAGLLAFTGAFLIFTLGRKNRKKYKEEVVS